MRRFRVELLILLGLATATTLAYLPLLGCGFVNFDDGDYVTDNRHVQSGLTASNVRWAFTTAHASNWHPLTWLSLQFDATVFGTSARVYHLMNLALHVSAALLLFVTLRLLTGSQERKIHCATAVSAVAGSPPRLTQPWHSPPTDFSFLRSNTGAVWRSALVAALFALHPLHVESVAWIAERKDVLCGVFWMLTLLAYAAYTARPGLLRYLAVVGAFVLALLAKPMAVTLPCVLLLLDGWPLGRLHGALRRCLSEKLPLFALSAASCWITLLAQRDASRSLTSLPLIDRLRNVVVAYADYLLMTVRPVDLALLYPNAPDALPGWRIGVAAILLLILSVVAVVLARRFPYVLVGWLWYLGTLVPVIGLVQVGEQARADRYTYLPLIGIFLVVAWGLPDLLSACRGAPRALVVPVLFVLLGCGVATWKQVGYWHDSIRLWRRSLEVSAINPIARNNLGSALIELGFTEEAAEQFRTAVEQRGGAYARARCNLGLALAYQGRFVEARQHYLRTLDDQPDLAACHSNLGLLDCWEDRPTAAVESFERAVALQPEVARYRFHLGFALTARAGPGDGERAEAEYQKGLRLDPNWPDVMARSAWMLARQGQRTFEAVTLASEACQATGFRRPRYLHTLAAAYAAAGQFEPARATARLALQRAHAEAPELADEIERALRRYEANRSFFEGS